MKTDITKEDVFNSLEELNELIDEVKEKVIIGCDDIEIYDDYRE